jgi:hypothetical protein
MREKDPEDPTRLRLASERSEAEIAALREREEAQRAAQHLADGTRRLVANILRIIAGAGKHYELIDQMIAVLNAFHELQPYTGKAAYPSHPIAPIAEALTDLDWRKNNPDYPDYVSPENRRQSDGSLGVRLAEEAIIKAALRVTAARLARQPTQESISYSHLIEALVEFERARDNRRRRLTAPQTHK